MGQPRGAMQHPGRRPSARPPVVGAPPRADPVAAVLLLVAGAVGVWQLLLPWRAVADGVGSAAGEVKITGWQVYRLLRAVPSPTGDLRVATYCVLGVAVGGAALIVLGLTMMLAVDHRPLGAAAMLVSVLSLIGVGWLLVRAQAIFNVGLSGLFDQAQIGWFLFLTAGLIGVIGSWKALATG